MTTTVKGSDERLREYCERGRALLDEVIRQIDEGELDRSLVPRDCLVRMARMTESDASLSTAAIVSKATAFYIRNLLNFDVVPDHVRRAVLNGVIEGRCAR